MRSVRGITYPFKISAAVRISHSKRVFGDISNAVHGSNIQWRGRSFAASVPSNSSKPQKGQKRISKDERKAILESFIDKYKASNAGKFPTPSAARKQVGGSYYVVRQILQELVYRSKISSTSKTDATLLEVPNEECQSSAKVIKEVSSSAKTVHLTSYVPRNPTATILQGDLSNSIETNSHQMKLESKEVLRHPDGETPEGSEKVEATCEVSLDINGGTREVVQATGHDAPDSDMFERKENKDHQLPKRSTVWGNLRSFADGFINLWRKM